MLKKIILALLLTCVVFSVASAAGKTTTLRILGASGFTEELTKKYTGILAKQGIKVEGEFYDWNTYDGKQKLAMTSNGGDYDIVFLPGNYVNIWAIAGALVPMDGFMKKNHYSEADIYDSVKKFAKVDGKWYIVPYSAEAMVYYYRTDIYQKEGIKPPKTIDEMYASGKKLTKDGMFGLAYPGGPEEGSCSFWSYFLWSYGGTYFDKSWKPQLNSPEALKSAEMFAKILKDCAPPGVATWQNEETVSAFSAGNIAAMIMWPGYYQNLSDKTKSKVFDKLGVAPVPAGPTGKAVPRFGAWGLGITKNCKNAKAAETFIKMYTDQKGLAEVVKYDCSSSKKVNNNPKFRTAYPPLGACAATLDFGEERPAIPEAAQYISLVGNGINAIVAGKDAKTTLDEVNKQVFNMMKDAGYYK